MSYRRTRRKLAERQAREESSAATVSAAIRVEWEQLQIRDEGIHVLVCAACPRVSSVTARGWAAHRTDEGELNEPPALAFYCPACRDTRRNRAA